MMAALKHTPHLIDRLPTVRGRYSPDAPLAQVTWFQVGGPAEVLFRPADIEDLAAFLAGKPDDVPVTVIGVASNLLVRDGGVPGVVIRLGRGFVDMTPEGDRLHVGAGALDTNVAIAARNAGIAGLEFLSGVPGTIGGALRMNAGAYGSEMKDIVVSAMALNREGVRHRFTAPALGFTYRHCALTEDWIFVGAELRGRVGDPAVIQKRIDDIAARREASQPVRTRTGGSTFANPANPEGRGHKAWELIDKAGCRGLRFGGAMVSEKHANFLINTGKATAADIEALGEDVRRRVFDAFGVVLEWEIRRIGVPAPEMNGGAA